MASANVTAAPINDSDDTLTLAIGVGVGCAVGLGLLGAIVGCVLWRRRRASPPSPSASGRDMQDALSARPPLYDVTPESHELTPITKGYASSPLVEAVEGTPYSQFSVGDASNSTLAETLEPPNVAAGSYGTQFAPIQSGGGSVKSASTISSYASLNNMMPPPPAD